MIGRVGPYEVLAEEDAAPWPRYRARDARSDRIVSLTVLPTDYGSDGDRVRRFEDEAKAVAALNHPGIAGALDVGVHEGAPSHLEGETLRARIARGPLSTAAAVDLGRRIAEGLAAAHAAHALHLGLSPDHVWITPDQHARILHVGAHHVAAPSAASTSSPAEPISFGRSRAPEQNAGGPIDQRSDVYALGALLYEMLCGRRALGEDGATANDGAAPPLTYSASGPLASADRIVRRCLQRDPADRFQSARDVAFALDAVMPGAALDEDDGQKRVGRTWVLAGLGLLFTLVAFWAAMYRGGGTRTGDLETATIRQVSARRGVIHNARFSRDGRGIVFSGAWNGSPSLRLYAVRDSNDDPVEIGPARADLLALSATDQAALALGVVEPGAARSGTVALLPISGGDAQTSSDEAAWADFAPDGAALAAVHETGGEWLLEYPKGNVLARSNGRFSHVRFSPDGRTIAAIEHAVQNDDEGAIILVDSREAGSARSLGPRFSGIAGLAWRPDGGEILIGGGSFLRAVNMRGVSRVLWRAFGRLTVQDVAPDGGVLVTQDAGRLALNVGGHGRPERDLAWLNASIVADVGNDGRVTFFEVLADEVGIYTRAMDGSPAVRIGAGVAQAFSPDGRRVLALTGATPPSIAIAPTGGGPPSILKAGSVAAIASASWFPDGQRVLFAGMAEGRRPRLYIQPVAGGEPQTIGDEDVRLGTFETHAVSPDAAWAIGHAVTGLYLRYPIGGGEPQPIPGLQPAEAPIRWSENGESLYVRPQSNTLPSWIDQVDLATGARQRVHTLQPSELTGAAGVYSIQVSPDGRVYAYTFARVQTDLYVIEGLR